MPAKKHVPDEKVLAVFDKMIAGVPGVGRKGDQMPYVSMNGNMYASVSKAGRIGLRLSKTDLAEFLDTYAAGLHEGYPGFFQKEYAAIPEALYDDPGTLQSWFARSHAHAAALKPKPTKK
jgi:TfoX/Sxy family transcriptional regulator of competence genes